MSTGRGERFTIPDSPVRRCLKGLPAFVQTVGGGYFFLPGLSALRFLASLPDRAGPTPSPAPGAAPSAA
jgi:hypothetical protein